MTAIMTRITPADLLEMEDAHRFELVDGLLVKRDVGAISSFVAARIIQVVGSFV